MKREELSRETDHLISLRRTVEAELGRIPGVRGVGVAVCERAGLLTGELGFRIYVAEKRPRRDVPRAQLVPPTILGYPTDVHAVPRSRAQCCGATRPLLGGLEIRTAPSSEAERMGTLGCFVTIAGAPHGLTNEHVLLASRATLTDRQIFQPKRKDVFGATCNEIGVSVQNLGFKGDFSFNGQTHFIDCAAVKLQDVDFASRFVLIENSDSGAHPVTLPSGVPGSVIVNSDGEVVEIHDAGGALVDTTRIVTAGTPVLNTLVWKVGAATGLTVGLVEVADGPAEFADGPLNTTGQHQITIKPIAGKDPTTQETVFTTDGDSGSVYVDLQNRIIGLHHHGRGTFSVGSQIAPVFAKLGATLIANGGTTHEASAPSTALARALWIETPASAQNLDVLEKELRIRVSRSKRGRRILALMDTHLAEILRLVWQRRAVTVVWHRHHGPAFVVLFARALARRSDFPAEAGGVSRRAVLAAMADVLCREGSPALRADIEAIRPWLFELLAGCVNVDDFCDRLAEEAA